MSSLITPDQSAILATAGLSAPKLTDFVAGVPLGSLAEVWRKTAGITIASGKVASWTGFYGTVASQSDATKRPTINGSGNVDFTATADALVSTMALPAAGYLAVVAIPRTTGLGQVFAGEQSSGASPFARLGIGEGQGNKVGAYIGAQTVNANVGTTALVVGTKAIAGVQWDAVGNYTIRVNGAVEKTGTYTGSDSSSIGTQLLALGGMNTGVATIGIEGTFEMLATAVYGVGADLAAVDAALALF